MPRTVLQKQTPCSGSKYEDMPLWMGLWHLWVLSLP